MFFLLRFCGIIVIWIYPYFVSMPAKGKIKKTTRKRAPRKCSLCGRNGHNARTCERVQKQQIIPKAKQKKRLLKSKSAIVLINVTDRIETSPHVVRIAPSQKRSHWDKVKVYQDSAKKIEHKTVDFAQMVRHANAKSEVVQENIVENKNIETKEVTVDILQEIAKIKKTTPERRSTISSKRALRKLGVKKPSLRKRINRACETAIINTVENIHDGFVSWQQQFHIKKFVISAIAMLMIVALPFPAVGFYHKLQDDTTRIVEESTHAFLSLQSSTVAAFNNNIDQAQYDLTAALNSFGTVEQIIDEEYNALVAVARILPVLGNKVTSRQELLLAGHNIALGNTYLVKGFDEIKKREDLNLLDQMLLLQRHIKSAIPPYEIALTSLDRVDNDSLPLEYQQSFEDFNMLFSGIVDDMKEMEAVVDGLHAMLGGESFKRYLILFQNHHELRPTGGFVGSYATIDVQQGKILDINIPGGGSYDMQGQLDVFVKPPLPLQLVNNRWEFQDGNWFPDFKTSAQKMSWFYQHGRQRTVDGVIAVNSTVLERMLRVMGPIANDDFDVFLDGESGLKTLQNEIESYEDLEENAPKEILSVLLEQLISQMQNIEPESVVSLVSELHSALEEKEIQFYFDDEGLQELFAEYGWTGEIKQTLDTQDYLMVVNSNLHGKKSDAKIKQHIQHQAVVQDDGSIINTVLITREHGGVGNEQYFDEPNIDYVRMYVPEGAELLDAGGFVYPDEASFLVPPTWYEDDPDVVKIERDEQVHVETGTRITSEFGKTTFGNWIVTMPGEETNLYFTYQLPFNIFETGDVRITQDQGHITSLLHKAKGQKDLSRYSVVLQKQSGAQSDISHTIIYPDGWIPVWQSGTKDMDISINGAQIETLFDTDYAFGVMMQRQ